MIGFVRHGKAPSRVIALMQDVADRVASFPIVSCDVFDTAVFRRLARPEDVLLAVGARARSRGLVACVPEAFQEYRLEAERSARAAAEAIGHDEVTIVEIYRRLLDYGVVGDPETAMQLAALEFAVERSICVAAAPIRALLSARAPGQRVIFISDTTLPGTWLAELLRGVGYGDDCTVFSSADARRSKHTGRLFAHVLQVLGCSPKDIVHLGDNPGADVAQAQAHGIMAIHLPQPGRPPEPARLAQSHFVLRLLHSWRRSLAGPSTAEQKTGDIFLHRYLTALLLGFTLFVLAEAKRRNVRRIYFLSRDGYLPYVLARRLIERSAQDVELTYLHVSRRSITVPAKFADLPALAEATFESNEGQLLSTALAFIGIDATTASSLLTKLGIDAERRVGRGYGRDELQRLFVAESELITAQLAEMRSAALGYLDQSGFLAPGPRLIVDVGWRGTTQEALIRLTGLPPGDVAGCYLGLWPSALRPHLNERNAKAYLFSFGHPRSLMDMVKDGYIVLELLFSAANPPVLHYQQNVDGRAVPVYAIEREPGAEVRRRAMEELEARCVEEFAALDAILDGAWPESIDPTSAIFDIERLLTKPEFDEVAAINRIPFVHGADGAENGIAVNQMPLHEWLRPKAMLRRIERAAWRAGATRVSLPRPIPSMTFRDLQYRVGKICHLLGQH